MENTKRMMGERKPSSTKSLTRIANYAILEKQRSGTTKGKSSIRCVCNQDDNNALFRHIKETGHSFAWERVEFWSLSKGHIAEK